MITLLSKIQDRKFPDQFRDNFGSTLMTNLIVRIMILIEVKVNQGPTVSVKVSKLFYYFPFLAL